MIKNVFSFVFKPSLSFIDFVAIIVMAALIGYWTILLAPFWSFVSFKISMLLEDRFFKAT